MSSVRSSKLAAILFTASVAASAIACKGGAKDAPSGSAPAATTGSGSGSATAPAPSANPAVAELAPLWPEIATCEDTSDLHAKDKCPANFKLLETMIAATAAADKDAARFGQLHEALVDHVVNGTDPKARSCAAYADWAKANRGGAAYQGNTALATQLVGALSKLAEDDGGVGYGIANMLGGWWKKDGEVRTAMIAAFKDHAVKSAGGRTELMRHAGWVAAATPEVLSALTVVAADVTDKPQIRREALSALSGAVREKPELVDILVTISADADADAKTGAIQALGEVKAGTPEADKAQTRMIALLEEPETTRALPTAFGKIADGKGLTAFAAHYAATASKEGPGASAAFSDFLYAMALSGRIAGSPDEAAVRTSIDKLLKDKQLAAFNKGYVMASLGALGGPKSVATCKKFEKDADAGVAAAAAKCTAAAAKPAAK